MVMCISDSGFNAKLFEDIKKLISERKDDYSDKIQITSVLLRYTPDNSWQNLITIVKPIRKDEKPVIDKLDYKILLLTKYVIELSELIELISNISKSRLYIADNTINVINKSNPANSIMVRHDWIEGVENPLDTFSSNVFEFNIGMDSNLYNQDIRLVKNERSFQNQKIAAQYWTDLTSEYIAYKQGKLILFLPNYKARISSISTNDINTELIVKIEGNTINLQCHAYLAGQSKKDNIYPQPQKVVDGEAKFQIDRAPKDLLIELVSDTDERVDSYQLPNYYHLHPGKILFDNKLELFENVAKGEGQNTEFKPGLQINDDFTFNDQKINEIIESICAFANTNNGSVYFGIKDDTEIVGISDSLTKGNFNNYCENFEKALRLRLDKDLLYHPDIKYVKHPGVKVIELIITKNQDKKCQIIKSGAILKRAGSNNKKWYVENNQNTLV